MDIRPDLKKEFFEFLKQKMEKKGIPFDAADFEDIEEEIIGAVSDVGKSLYKDVLTEKLGAKRESNTLQTPAGNVARFKDRKKKTIITFFGEVESPLRDAFHCPTEKKTYYPGDIKLGLSDHGETPRFRKSFMMFTASMSFHQAAQSYREMTGYEPSLKKSEDFTYREGEKIEKAKQEDIIKAMDPGMDPKKRSKKIVPYLAISLDGAHAPILPEKGEKKPENKGESRGWTETKVAKLFSFETIKSKAGEKETVTKPLAYVAGTETSDNFGKKCYAAASLFGCLFSTLLVVIGDGAKWIRSIAEMHFPNAIMIVDWYHAVEHLWEAMTILFGEKTKATVAKVEILKKYLWDGNVEKVIETMQKLLKEAKALEAEEQKAFEGEIGYFKNNVDRMKYADYRAQGLPIGSGSVESACKQIVAGRLKLPGMKWRVKNLPNIVAVRCEFLNRRDCQQYLELAA